MLTMIPQLIIGLVDLAAAFLFMYGLQRMSSPATAPSGILVAGIGMLAAVLASFLYVFSVSAAAGPHLFVNVGLALIALIVGGGVAWWSGKTVAMTAMPQMVALYNGMGGGAAGAIAAVELLGGRAQGVTATRRYAVGRADWCCVAVRLLDRLGQARRGDQEPAARAGQQVFNALVLIATLAVGAYIVFVFESGADPLDRNARSHRLLLRPRAGLRRSDDASDRRGGHAGRHLDLQRLHRPGRRPRRLSSCRIRR